MNLHKNLNLISEEWCSIPEHCRIRMYSRLIKRQNKFFKNTKVKLTSRHLFFKMQYHRFYDEGTTYKQRLVYCNAEFDALTLEERAYYKALCKTYSNRAWLHHPETPIYMKRQYKLFQSLTYKSTLKRPCGPYHEFMIEYQKQHPNLAGISSVALAKLCREPYSQLPPEELERYKTLFNTHMEEFRKQDLIERFKFQEKNKKNYFDQPQLDNLPPEEDVEMFQQGEHSDDDPEPEPDDP